MATRRGHDHRDVVRVAVDRSHHERIDTVAADEHIAAVAAAPDRNVAPAVAVHDVAVGLRRLLGAADDHVVAGAAAHHVAAEQPDQHVVAAVAFDHVGVVEALVGSAQRLDRGILLIVVIGAEQEIAAVRALDEGRSRVSDHEQGSDRDGHRDPQQRCEPRSAVAIPTRFPAVFASIISIPPFAFAGAVTVRGIYARAGPADAARRRYAC